MNRYRVLLLALIASVVIAMFAIPSSLGAASLSIGGSAWYAWWDPHPSVREADADPGIMYGPQVVLSFTPTISLSSSFLYGIFQYNGRSDGGTCSMDIRRYDSDTTMVYALNSFVRFFGGVKYMGYKYEMGEHWSVGPGAGFGFVIPMAENIFWTINISGIYLWGKQNDESSEGDRSVSIIEYGANASASLVYRIPSVPLSLSVGGRYFFFKFEATDDAYSDVKEYHHFYGITASAMYSFSF
jgi:hypothetical protein